MSTGSRRRPLGPRRSCTSSEPGTSRRRPPRRRWRPVAGDAARRPRQVPHLRSERRRVGEAGRQGVDADAMGRPLQGQRPGEVDDHRPPGAGRELRGRRMELSAGGVHQHVELARAASDPLAQLTEPAQSRVSAGNPCAAPPPDVIRSATSSSGSCLRPTSRTMFPACASRAAHAAPMPGPPPVTTAVGGPSAGSATQTSSTGAAISSACCWRRKRRQSSSPSATRRAASERRCSSRTFWLPV